MRRPKLLQPRPTTETTSPDDPSRRYRMSLTSIRHYPQAGTADAAGSCGGELVGGVGWWVANVPGWRSSGPASAVAGPGADDRHPGRMFGGDLLSHPVARAVPSALTGLASGFGMEPGVSPSLWPPKLYGDVTGPPVPLPRSMVRAGWGWGCSVRISGTA